ncbi:MATE family efflux transporter [Campylobacter geochelonis]|uniref:Mate efflux family protein n=1 Tax=Campylobacter geochelonis TaxID=1780362 RepID=A0A128EKF1_9BACT|nr:MATE family efflux transporter [Campylobacter geochelonis]QKF71583.1 MATE family efflux protein [Campylobacter geochelonis]CZE49350.1 mate efflux family protein [Campylobacter geochelonis]
MHSNFSLKKLFLPIYLDMILKLTTVMINTYMISIVNPHLVGAMGAGNQIFSLFVNVFSFLAVGCSVVVAQAIGAKNNKVAIRAIHTSISFNSLLGFLSGVLVFLYARLLLNLLQIPDEIFNESYKYLRIISITFFIDAVAIVISAVIRVYGFVKHIMITSIIMNIVTIIGNIFALFEPFGLPFYGLSGVGISTIAGRILGIFILSYLLVKVVKVPIYLTLFIKVKAYILKKILFIGLPSAGENLIWTVQYLVAFSFVASMGEDSLAVQTIYFQISAFMFFASSAVGIANEVIVGRMVGAKELENAYKRTFRSLKMGLAMTLVFVLFVYINKNFIMNLLKLTPDIKDIMSPLFVLSIFLELARTQNVIMVNALRASGDARFPFYMGLVFMWGVSIPLGWFLGIYLGYGIIGVWIGFFADELLRGLANTFRWKSKKWQEKRLV